jgi:MOSC domain-containing protein
MPTARRAPWCTLLAVTDLTARHLSYDELELGLPDVLGAPSDVGTVELIVRRPVENGRELLDAGELDLAWGLVGDTWSDRYNRFSPDGTPDPDAQLNVIGARFSRALSADPDRRALTGDQLHLDLDLSRSNLPTGTRLALGSAVIEVTARPHKGCAKFSARFGPDAMRFVNSAEGRSLRLRGLNARVVVAGVVRVGDVVRKLP